ncbi:MAG: copper chaperone PCu(A)C [Pseudomonadota bacterium]
MKLKTVLISAMALASISVSALADDYKVGQVMIKDTWARVTLQSRPAAAYMQIHNMGETADKIVAASSPLAERVELHTHSMDEGVMRMRKVEEIAVPAKGQTELKPGGLHLMIFGLKREIKKGEMLPLKLTLQEAGEVEIMAKVGAKAGGSDHSGHDHNHSHSHGQTQ